MSDITYINKDLLMEGTLESKEGQVIIAGTFKGNVTAKSLIIENTCKFNGNINSEHVRVEGNVVGDIKCNSLSIEETGVLKGNIDAELVSIAGRFDGQVLSEVVSIRSTGSVTGEVSYDNISIEEGAKVEAQLGKKKQ